MLPTMQVLVQDVVYVSQGDMSMYVGDYDYKVGARPGDRSKLLVNHPKGASVYP